VPDEPVTAEFHVEDQPDPLDLDVLETQIRREASAAMGLGGEAEAAARGRTQTVHFTYAFQARALYEQNGYELVGCVQDFPSGTDVLWYRKRLKGRADRR
jgi:hypothetical protein